MIPQDVLAKLPEGPRAKALLIDGLGGGSVGSFPPGLVETAPKRLGRLPRLGRGW
jgi:hypothetical protein